MQSSVRIALHKPVVGSWASVEMANVIIFVGVLAIN